MTTALSVSVAGVDIATAHRWVPDQVPGRLDGPERVLRSLTIPTRGGVLVTGSDVLPRTLSITGILRAGTVAQREERERAVAELMFRGLVRVVAADGALAMAIEGHTTKLDIEPQGRGRAVRFSRVTATILCPDPVWRATAMTGIAITAPNSRVTLPLGSAASDPVIHLMGPSTNVVFTLRDGGGNPIGVPLAFAAGLGTTEYLAIDMRRVRIDRVTAGVAVNGRSLLAAGTFPFPLDPRRGPITAEVSSGTAQILYLRGWR